MNWDYSIYPELTEDQKRVFSVAGQTLLMIQLAESSIQNCCVYVFKDQKELNLEDVYSAEEKTRKKTLGQLIKELQKRIKIHPQFESMLKTFVEDRNYFIHKMFNDPNSPITTKSDCDKIVEILSDLQDYAWNIGNVFLGCFITWTKESGVYQFLPESVKNDNHLLQIEKRPFHLLFGDNDNEISTIMKKRFLKPDEDQL